MAADNVASMHKVEDKMRQGYADLAAIYKGNLDAMLASSQAVMGGFQTLNAEALAFLQNRVKDSLATSKRLAECTSAESALEIQMDFVKVAMQSYADQFAKFNELTGKVVNDSFAPLKQNADAAVSKAAESVAA